MWLLTLFAVISCLLGIRASGETEACDIKTGLALNEEKSISQHPPADLHDDELSWIRAWNNNCFNTKPILAIDEAWISVRSKVNNDILLLQENGQCFGCPLKELASVSGNQVKTRKVQTQFNNRFGISLVNSQNVTHCQMDVTMRQHGDYWLIVSDTVGKEVSCQFLLANDPSNIYLPILYVFIVLIGLTIIYAILSRLHSSGCLEHVISWKRSVDLQSPMTEMSKQNNTGSNENANNEALKKPETAASPRKRLVSLDTFRGLSLVIMIFVNYGGGSYYFFMHAPWNGLLVADLVFPWFVFMMGTSIAFSFRGMVKRQVPRWRIMLRVLKRTALLFLIGLSLNSRWYNYLSQLRIPGVLQRLALTYFLTALPHVFCAKTSQKSKGYIHDITDYWPEWIVNLGYLAAHLALTFALPVPGCPKGYLGPGGMHDGGQNFNCSGGAAGYIDRIVLTNNHIYQNPTSKTLYHAVQAFDPEGLLGTLSSAFTCFLGLQAGKILLYHKSHSGRLIRWSSWALLTGGGGMLLCKCSLNDGWIPINKNLWSVSFALVIAATGYACLSIFYVLTDLTQVWSGAPFLYPGLNSLVVYVCHDVFSTYFPVRWKVEDAHWALLLMACWSTACWVVMSYVLYRKKIFVAL